MSEKKEPWQMTKKEYIATGTERARREPGQYTLKSNHEQAVKNALQEGKPVPAVVLADYPDMPRPTETIDLSKGRMVEVPLDAAGHALPPEEEDELLEGVKPLGAGDIASGWQKTRHGRMIYQGDLLLENAKEEFVYEKITNAPSYPKLLAAYKGHLRSLYSADDPFMVERMQEVELQPWELLTAHAGVMKAKSARAITLRNLADSVFKETELPRLPEGKFRGESGLDWDNLEVPAVKPTAMSPVDYDRRYSLEELREMARQAGLSASGSKKEIAARLIAEKGA